MSAPGISIVLPTCNAMATMPALLEALRRQRINIPFEIVAVDSASTDGTSDLLRRDADKLIEIPAVAFNHGLTRNLGIEHARAELVVLLVQDALPANDEWLAALVAPLVEDHSLAGTFARQRPRDDASAITRWYARRSGAASDTGRTMVLDRTTFAALRPRERLDRCAFDNVCSCIRRSVWREHPFRATTFAEDLEWARDVLLAGYRLAYAPRAVVVHSHDRSVRYEFARTCILHRRLFELFELRTIPTLPLLARAIASSVILHLRCRRESAGDVRAAGTVATGARARGRVAARAVHRGVVGRAGMETIPSEDGVMRILEVVHGFPPAAQGGSEIYAHAHARALHRQYGDEVVVLTREQNPSRREYSVRTEDRDGIRIIWVNNTFRATRTFEETYRNKTIDAIAAHLIDGFRPDVAHIHHLTCLSTTIVKTLARRGIPSVLTLHDYWLICHRGQLLDVNLEACDGPGELGCNRCLGLPGRVPEAVFATAPGLRSFAHRLPAATAHQLRGVAERLMAWDGSAADGRAARRLAHMREVCAEVTQFLAPSHYVRDRFVQFGVPAERITVAGYGFDHAPFAGLERPSSPSLRLGFLGSLMVSKAPHVLLRAFSRLPRGAASVSLFGAHTSYHGDVRYRQQLEPLLAAAGVRCNGAIPHDRVAAALASIDVLVVPSIWPENSPLVIQEAFLAGVPVVAARIGGIPEVVDDGRNGLLFEPGSVDDLYRVLSRLVDEPTLLETLRCGVPGVLTIEEDVARTRRLYEASLSTRRVVRRASSRAARLAAIVLNYRTPDESLLAIRSLLASRRPIDWIILVDSDPIDERCRDLTENVAGLTYLRTDENLGFSGGMNVGIRTALSCGADAVMLVNSDAIVPPDCIAALERCLDATTDGGVAGPVLRSRSHPGRLASAGMSYTPRSGRMRHLSFGARAAPREVRPDRRVDGVSGCAMLVRREVFEAIGLLDEDYFYSFEDLDFCLKARRAGFATLVAGAATAYHEGGRTIGSDSPRRLYFAARNHLLMARRVGPPATSMMEACRVLCIVALNLAHAVVASGGSLLVRLAAVSRGTWDYALGRLGDDR